MNAEQAKYEKVWQHARYRETAPGEIVAGIFKQVAKPQRDEWCIDFGAGTGRGSLMVSVLCGLRMHMVDFADNCLDESMREALERSPERFKFTQHDLTKPLSLKAAYGYCTDVMEHIPPADVDAVLKNIVQSAKNVFFQIACQPDNLGVLIGEQLHLTVEQHDWWKERLKAAGCVVLWSKDYGGLYCSFYVTRYANGHDLVDISTLNVSDDEIARNIKANLALGLPEIRPYERQDKELMLLAGGPSLAQFEDDIKAKRADGIALVTTNGAYHWCIEHGLSPGAQIVLDGREFNKRFVEPPVVGCKYLLASQCHPDLVAAAPRSQTILWHAGSHQAVKDAVQEHDTLNGTTRDWYPVHGGMTVILRAIPLLLMLGYSKFHIYGFDSCLMDGKHHAYDQPENDQTGIADVRIRGSNLVFSCHGWMATQAQQFIDLHKMIADLCEMVVYGDGLIAHIIQTAAMQGGQVELTN